MPGTTAAFLDMGAMATLGGAVVGTTVVSNTARVLTKIESLILPFVISLLVVTLTTMSAASLREPTWYLLTLINTCLLFCSALGVNSTVIQAAGRDMPGIKKQSGGRIPFFSSWTTKQQL